MATKNNPGAYDCYAGLEPDEPYFLLRGRDPIGSYLTAAWVALRTGRLEDAVEVILRANRELQACGKRVLDPLDPKAVEATVCSQTMLTWHRTQQINKIEEELKRGGPHVEEKK